ncbi:MAG: 50S ribosomal protein L18e [Promethearchaeota archaeon]
MGRKVTGPLDINVRRMIRTLEKTKIRIWRTIAEQLRKPRRQRVEANLGHINRVTKPDDIIVVPGKVLGAGRLEKKVTIGALAWSKSAEKLISESGSTIMSLQELLEKYPSGSNIKIIK